MRKNTIVLFAVVLALVASSACNRSPTAPSMPIQQQPQQPPPGARVHSIPLPGSNETFDFWISYISPGYNAQLTVGQPLDVVVRCAAPPGYRFMMSTAFSNGPSTPIDFIPPGGESGAESVTSACPNGNTGSYKSTAKVDMPDPLYYRIKVWVRQGEDGFIMSPGYTQRLGDPYVADDWLGWTKPD